MERVREQMSDKQECFGWYSEDAELSRKCGLCAYRGHCMATTQTGQWQMHDDPHRDDLTPRPDPIDLVQNHSVPRAVMDRSDVVRRARELLLDPIGARWTNAWFDAAISLATSKGVNDMDLLGWLVERALRDEEQPSRRELDLRTLMLLSALESWAYSLGKTMPKFMEDETRGVCEALKQEVLK